MTATTPTNPSSASPSGSSSFVELSPKYAIPIVLVLASLPLALFQPWAGLVISLFGLFLLFQTISLRLRFTATDLDIYRGESLIRRFPYQNWQSWRIFWSPVPILFYFKEVKSIHFLPILFDAKMLRVCLEECFPTI